MPRREEVPAPTTELSTPARADARSVAFVSLTLLWWARRWVRVARASVAMVAGELVLGVLPAIAHSLGVAFPALLGLTPLLPVVAGATRVRRDRRARRIVAVVAAIVLVVMLTALAAPARAAYPTNATPRPAPHADEPRRESLGDPTTAKNLVILLPGVNSNPDNYPHLLRQRGLDVKAEMDRTTGNAADNAVLTWSYRAPQMLVGSPHQVVPSPSGWLDAASPAMAEAAAQELVDRLPAIIAANPGANLTIGGHSYGSLVAGYVARIWHETYPDKPFPANLILMGSPGVGSAKASDLGTARSITAMRNASDLGVPLAPPHGPGPTTAAFNDNGQVRIAISNGSGHDLATYLARGSEGLRNFALIATDRPGVTTRAADPAVTRLGTAGRVAGSVATRGALATAGELLWAALPDWGHATPITPGGAEDTRVPDRDHELDTHDDGDDRTPILPPPGGGGGSGTSRSGGVDLSAVELRYLAEASGSRRKTIAYGLRAPATGAPGPARLALHGVDAARDASDAFFVWLALRPESFTVNLNPAEPDRIIDRELGRTDAGRVLLEADLRMKRTIARAIHPDTRHGARFWQAFNALAAGSSTRPCLSFRTWIVPAPATVRATRDSISILRAPLDVKTEAERLRLARGPRARRACPDATPALERRQEALLRRLVLPHVRHAINHAPEYAPLRRVYFSRVAAAWYRDRKGRDGAFASLIDRGRTTPWHSRRPWSPRAVFDRYVRSARRGEFHVTRRTRRGSVIRTRTYVFGGVDFSRIRTQPPRGEVLRARERAVDTRLFASLAHATPDRAGDEVWEARVIAGTPPGARATAATPPKAGNQVATPAPTAAVSPHDTPSGSRGWVLWAIAALAALGTLVAVLLRGRSTPRSHRLDWDPTTDVSSDAAEA